MSTCDTGYRPEPAAGPRIRSDVVDVYVFQRSVREPKGLWRPARRGGAGGVGSGTGGASAGRAGGCLPPGVRGGAPLGGSWHPVMGHVERGEKATDTLWRELREELGLEAKELVGAWALEQVHPFFIAELDAIVMSPRFAAEVKPGWTPTLNEEHSAFRWVAARDAAEAFMWPGQISACREIVDRLLPEASLMRDWVRVSKP